MLTQCDDDGREFVVAYVSRSNNKTKVKYSSYEWECLVLFGQFIRFSVIFMVAHSLWLQTTSF
jgi:hypothetical protein